MYVYKKEVVVLSHCPLLNGAKSDVHGCKDRKSRQLTDSPISHTVCTHYDLLYAEKTNTENAHVINRPVVHRNMPFSAAYSVPIACYERVRTQGFPFHQTEKNLYTMVCETNTERGSHITLMAISLPVICQCLILRLFI